MACHCVGETWRAMRGGSRSPIYRSFCWCGCACWRLRPWHTNVSAIIKWAAPQGWCPNSLPACPLLQSKLSLYPGVCLFARYHIILESKDASISGPHLQLSYYYTACALFQWFSSLSALLTTKVGRTFEMINLPQSISISYLIYILHRRHILPSIPILIFTRAKKWCLILWLKTGLAICPLQYYQ